MEKGWCTIEGRFLQQTYGDKKESNGNGRRERHHTRDEACLQ